MSKMIIYVSEKKLICLLLFPKYTQLAFQGPLGPEMLALRLAFRTNLFQTNGPTRRFMYIDRK